MNRSALRILSSLASFFVLIQMTPTTAVFAANEKYTAIKKPVAVVQPTPKTSQMMVKKNFDLGTPDPNSGPAKIKVVTPMAGATVKGTFDIKVDASGGGGAKQVKIDYNDGSGWNSAGSSNNPQGTVFTIPWNSTVLKKDGDVNFAIGADHKDGSTSFVNIKVTVQNAVEKAPPVIKFHNITPNMEIKGTYPVYTIATDDVGVTQVDIFADGKSLKPVSMGQQNDYSASWDSTASADGPVTLTADAYDKAGNKTTATVQVKVNNHGDKIAPTVKILSPTFNQSFNLGDKITISADAQDNDAIDHVEFFGEQNVDLGAAKQAPYEKIWDPQATGAQNGPASVRVVAFDKAGNSAEAKQSIVLVNPKYHSVKITPSPADGATVHGKFTVSADCNPPDDVAAVNFSYGGNPNVPVKGGNPYEYNWDLTGKPDGDIELLMVAVDKNNGYLGEKQVTYHIQNIQDNTPPKITITSPSNNESISGKATFSADVTDDGQIDYVTFFDNQSFSQDVHGNGPYSVTYDTQSVKDGPMTLSVTAKDKSNNSDTKSINVKIENDAMAPLCEITAPQDGEEVKGNVTIKVQASDDKGLDNVQIYPNYQMGVFPGQSFQNAPYELTFDSTKVDDGTIPIVAVAVDKAGHETKSQIKVKVLNNAYHQITFDIKPAPETIVKGMTTLSVTCKPDDSKVDRVEVEYGKPIKGGNPFEYEWDTTKETNGQHGFTVAAYDNQGKQLGAQSYSWDVENT